MLMTLTIYPVVVYDTLVIKPVSPSTIPDTVQGSLQRVKDYSVAYGG